MIAKDDKPAGIGRSLSCSLLAFFRAARGRAKIKRDEALGPRPA
jgi:hypothetical protein